MLFQFSFIFGAWKICGVLSQSPARFQLNDPNHKGYNNRIYVGFNNISLINPAYPFKILAHGYTESGSVFYYQQIPDLYLSKGNYNIIGVDWTGLAKKSYLKAPENTKIVGRYLGEFIVQLNRTLGINLDLIHLIGHSLGAHVAGFAGKYIIEILNDRIGRISGLDPAGPLFDDFFHIDPGKRLASTDAQMVDIVHTDAFQFGINEPIGTVDFYANGGFFIQPGCLQNLLSSLLSSFDTISVDAYIFCSHQHSVLYFMESINSKRFVGKCRFLSFCNPNNTAIFGDYTPANVSGVYQFRTNPNPPYARGP